MGSLGSYFFLISPLASTLSETLVSAMASSPSFECVSVSSYSFSLSDMTAETSASLGSISGGIMS